MAPKNYVKPSRIWLKRSPDFNEQWVQERIEEDTSLLGLGDLDFKESQRIQPSGGRLDLLLQDAETRERYEIEIQLGSTDESHIIRTLEYWDIERKRYPQYDHFAVIIAEDITSRFLNVISLFNGHIPIIAIQMQALSVGDSTTLVFTKVLDVVQRGLEEADEVQPQADRAYWEKKAAKSTVALADALLELVHEVRPDMYLNYVKHYIGLADDGRSDNFIAFKPNKKALNLEVHLPQSPETDQLIDDAGLETLTYDRQWGNYRIRLTEDDLEAKNETLDTLIRQAALKKG